MDRCHPHATKMMLFWGSVPKCDLVNLMKRLSVMLMPQARERVGDKAIMTTDTHRMSEEVKNFPVTPHEPMSAATYERRTVARRAPEKPVNVRRSGDADRVPS